MTPQRIKEEAIKADVKNQNASYQYRTGFRDGYIAGATAVNDRAQTAIDILQEAYDGHVQEKALLVERYPHLFPNIDHYVKPWVAKAKEFLDKWKGEVEHG
jgi:hypothetical protein